MDEALGLQQRGHRTAVVPGVKGFVLRARAGGTRVEQRAYCWGGVSGRVDAVDALPGIGPKLRRRLEVALGGAEGVTAALDAGDVAALSQVTGVSRQRAVRLVQAHRGEEMAWLRTDPARELAADALGAFLSEAVTSMGRAQLETLAPTRDAGTLDARLSEARAWLDRLAGVDLAPVRAALRRVALPTNPRPRPVRDVTVLFDEGPLFDQVRKEGLDRWVDTVAAGEEVWGDTLVLSASMQDLPRGALQITPSASWQAVPWADLAWAQANRELLEALSALHPVLGGEDAAGPILAALERDTSSAERDLGELAARCVAEANQAVEAGLEEVTLSGKELLEVMQGGSNRALERLVHEARNEARLTFEREGRVVGDPFTDTYPLQVDPRAVGQLERQIAADAALEEYRSALAVAAAVRQHRDAITLLVREAIELDRWQAVARAAERLGLTLPQLGAHFTVEGALHLALGGEGDRVDYPVPEGVALLTGANSGGKTTLLETLGQIAFLAHVGLPVPAAHAEVPVLDGLAYYARPRQLGAGAFEGFLRTIEEVLLADERVRVLADELEAMTELEAASAILAEVVARLDARQAPAVLVTHLAPFLLEHVEVRVDGIEATGLDDDNELVVARTPRVGHLARSTPELILQRLRNTAKGERRALYESMLTRLQGGT